MTSFEPLTLGYDWELFLLEATGEPVLESRIDEVASRLRRARPDCPCGLDFRGLELRSGPSRSFEELRDKTETLLALTAKEATRRKYHFVLSAGNPTFFNVHGAHLHVGEIYSATFGVKLRTALMPYLPALIALSAASPVSDGQVGEFKSYRVAHRAHGCNVPNPVGDPRTAELGWGEDACIKVWCHPTLELRFFDAPIHPATYLETAVLAAGLVAGMAKRLRRKRSAPKLAIADQEAYLLNRALAAKHGLQATFRRGDDEISAVTVVEEVLEIAADGMAAFGLPADDLVWIPKLLAARVTQADFLLEMAERTPDPWALLTDLTRLAPDGEPFERWLEAGPTREARPLESFGDLLLRGVDGFSRIRDLNRWANLPPFWLEREIEALEDAGRIETIEDPERGVRFRRLPAERSER